MLCYTEEKVENVVALVSLQDNAIRVDKIKESLAQRTVGICILMLSVSRYCNSNWLITRYKHPLIIFCRLPFLFSWLSRDFLYLSFEVFSGLLGLQVGLSGFGNVIYRLEINCIYIRLL